MTSKPTTMITGNTPTWPALALVTALLAGCASVPDSQPQSTRVDAAALGLSQSAAVFPRDDWWKSWNDPELDRLQQQALAANPDLKLAQARLRQAQAAAGMAQAALLPQVGAGLNSTRELFSANDLYPPPLGGGVYTESQLALQASWDIDFFGRNQAALAAARGHAAAAAAAAQAARVLLSAAVAQRYVQLAGALEQDRLLQTLRQQSEQTLQLNADRAAAGLDPSIPQRLAEVQLAQVRQQIERNQLAINQSRNALAALLGQGPQATAALAPRLQDLPSPQLPQQLPADLLGRRADVVAARWQAEAAQSNVKQARAAFYPDVNLSAFAGYAALGWTQFLQASNQTWGIGPAISLPIFEGGALTAQLGAAAAGADAAVEQYNATLIAAVREAADAIAQQRALQQQLQQQQLASDHAAAASALQRQRFDAGLGNRLALLQSEIGLQQQRLQLQQLKSAALSADIALIQALGGGYAEASKP